MTTSASLPSGSMATLVFFVMAKSLDPQNDAEFDAYASSYEQMHTAVLGITGEDAEYFARYKLNVLTDLMGTDRRPVLDYGCGIGNLTRLMVESLDTHGYDPSSSSVVVARERAPAATFYDDFDTIPCDTFGAVVLANVLHHVAPGNRLDLLRSLVPLLDRGGRLVIMEHNSWNPLTVRAVRNCEFDQGVSLLNGREIARLLHDADLGYAGRRYIVFFPRFLQALRPLEPRLAGLAIGAQVCVWATRGVPD